MPRKKRSKPLKFCAPNVLHQWQENVSRNVGPGVDCLRRRRLRPVASSRTPVAFCLLCRHGQSRSPPERRNGLLRFSILRLAPSAAGDNSSNYGQTQTGQVRSWTLPIHSGVYRPAPEYSDAQTIIYQLPHKVAGVPRLPGQFRPPASDHPPTQILHLSVDTPQWPVPR